MPIQVACPACRRTLRVPDNLIGQQVKCPSCMNQFVGRASVGESFTHEASFRELEEPPAVPLGRDETSERVREKEGGPHASSPPLPRPRYDDFDDEDDFENDRRHRRERYREEAIRRITGPANGVMAVGIIGLVVGAFGLVYALLQLADAGFDEELAVVAFGALLRVATIAVSIVMILAANKMKKLESYGFCKTMAILSAIPIISPCCILGLIFGLQANTVLSDPRVKDVFSS